MKLVYIVSGETGEYSDHQAWFVRAFLEEAPANALRDKLNAWCRERGIYGDKHLDPNFKYWGWDEKPEEDPDFRIDYTGTTYGVVSVPLGEIDKIPVKRPE